MKRSNYTRAQYSRKGSINNPSKASRPFGEVMKNTWKDFGTLNHLQTKEILTLGKYQRSPEEVDMIDRNTKVKKTK